MATVKEIKATARPKAGKGAARSERRAGRVPGVIYGDSKERAGNIEEVLLKMGEALGKSKKSVGSSTSPASTESTPGSST